MAPETFITTIALIPSNCDWLLACLSLPLDLKCQDGSSLYLSKRSGPKWRMIQTAIYILIIVQFLIMWDVNFSS